MKVLMDFVSTIQGTCPQGNQVYQRNAIFSPLQLFSQIKPFKINPLVYIIIFSFIYIILLSELTAASSVKVKILDTNDPYPRWLGIAINKPLGDIWWKTKDYTCNYLIDGWDVGKEFECKFTGSFDFAEASVSSDAGYTWKIRITYPNGSSFECVVDRRLRCPTIERIGGIEYFFYEDSNLNGKYDEGDIPFIGEVYFFFSEQPMQRNVEEIEKIIKEANFIQVKGRIEISLNKLKEEVEKKHFYLNFILKLDRLFFDWIAYLNDFSFGNSFITADFSTSIYIHSVPILDEDLEKAKNEKLRKEIPIYLLSPIKKLDYSLNRDAFSFQNWKDKLSEGYCCGMSITNAKLYEGVYKADKPTYELKKEDRIKVPVVVSLEEYEREYLISKTLEDVIRRDQLLTCIPKIFQASFQRLRVWLGQKSVEDVNREAFQELVKLIDEGKPALVMLGSLKAGEAGHAVVGIGYTKSVDDKFKFILVYDPNPVFPRGFSFDSLSKWVISISSEGKLLKTSYELLTVTSFTEFDINVTEEIINILRNLTEHFSEQLLERNLSLVFIYGNFSFQTDADYFYPLPGSKDIVFLLMEPKNEIKVEIGGRGAETYVAKPTSEMKANITVIKLEEGNFLITPTKVERIQRDEIYIIILIVAVIILVIVAILIFKRIFKRTLTSSASYPDEKEKR